MKVPVERYWGLPAVNGVRFSGPAPEIAPPPSAEGITPEAGYSVTGSFVAGGEITITKSGGGFGSRPTGFPVPLHYDTVDEWWDNGVLKTPYSAIGDGTFLSPSATTPYGSYTGMALSSDDPLPFRNRHYKSNVDGTWAQFRCDGYRSFPASRGVNMGTVYHRFWLYMGPEFANLNPSAPEKYLRIWDGVSDTNLRTTMDIYRAPATNDQITRSSDTRINTDKMNSPVSSGWNLIEHFFQINGVAGETISRSRINSAWSVNRLDGGTNWAGWPLTNGATPRGSIWDGNNAHTAPYGNRTGGAFGLTGAGKWLYAADVYSDITPQRIEIGASGLYTHNAKRNLALVTAWSDTQITARLFAPAAVGDRLHWVDELDVPHLIASFTG